MPKRPSFQFYPSDWLSDPNVIAMTAVERGAYIQLLATMWTTEDCSLRDDQDYLSRLAGVDKVVIASLYPCFKVVSGRLRHKRLDEERSKQDDYRLACSSAGKKGMKARWEAQKMAKESGSDKVVITKDNSSSSTPSSNKSFNKLKDKSPQKKEKVLKEFPEEVLELSKEFFLAVRSWLPEFQKKVETDAQITNLLTSDTWALEISRAISIDMRTSEQIRFLLHYVHGGVVAGRNFPVHNFWSKNILSPKKLREKFDQLTADARSKLGGRKNSVAQL